MSNPSGAARRRRWIWVVLVVVPLLLVGGGIGWAAYTFVNGTPGSSAQVAALQAKADEAFGDYPVRVTRLRHQSFIGKSWSEFTLVAVEDRSLRVKVSVYGGEPHWPDARRALKIKRDGEVGVAPRLLNPTPGPSASADGYWNISGSGPEADFENHRPYDWDTAPIGIGVYSSGDLTAGDAALVQEAVAGVGDRRDHISGIAIYPKVRVTGDPPYFYELTLAAAESPSLAEDFARVHAGETVPGITRAPR
ncbi:hypothetical protein AADG42_02230 [Ammonicoccus fulvus]|uniref:SURF1-like protein n=1 Tax=Ammonicoccus fulvus TaxID=3138240 RepID=A0ABZ3FLZ7_9ACTN